MVKGFASNVNKRGRLRVGRKLYFPSPWNRVNRRRANRENADASSHPDEPLIVITAVGNVVDGQHRRNALRSLFAAKVPKRSIGRRS